MPDVIPVAGQIDDAILLAFVLHGIVRCAGPSVVTEHWPGSHSSLRVVLGLARRS